MQKTIDAKWNLGTKYINKEQLSEEEGTDVAKQ